jgi:hypothetical protein
MEERLFRAAQGGKLLGLQPLWIQALANNVDSGPNNIAN